MAGRVLNSITIDALLGEATDWRKLRCPLLVVNALSIILVLTTGCHEDKPPEATRSEDLSPEVAAPARARLVIDTSTLDMGEGDIGKTSTRQIPVHNAGTAPLSFDPRSLDRSCNCSDVILPGDITPGGQDFVIVKWTPVQGQSGATTIAIKFRTNDPDMAEVRLELFGRVTPYVQFLPEDRAFVQFGKIKADSGAEREIRLVSRRLKEFDLEPVPPLHGVKVEVSKLSVDPAVDDFLSGYVLKVLATGDMPVGYFKDRILLKLSATGAQDLAPLDLPVYAEVDNGIFKVTVLGNTRETQVVFPMKSLTDGGSRVVQIRFFNPAKDDTLMVERCEPAFLKCSEPKRLEPGLWEFDVRVPAANEEAAKLRTMDPGEGLIVVRSSENKEPIAINVRWAPEGE